MTHGPEHQQYHVCLCMYFSPSAAGLSPTRVGRGPNVRGGPAADWRAATISLAAAGRSEEAELAADCTTSPGWASPGTGSCFTPRSLSWAVSAASGVVPAVVHTPGVASLYWSVEALADLRVRRFKRSGLGATGPASPSLTCSGERSGVPGGVAAAGRPLIARFGATGGPDGAGRFA